MCTYACLPLTQVYYTSEAHEWSMAVRTSPGATPGRFSLNSAGLMSPLAINVRLPLSEASIELACAVAEAAVTRWLEWMKVAPKQDQVKTMKIFAHDAKVRPSAVAAMAAKLDALLQGHAFIDESDETTRDEAIPVGGIADGGLGWEIAVADAGPLDITDRGAAQNQAAQSNFGEDERDAASVAMQQIAAEKGAGYADPGR
mmetsp:Transcript_84878/g.169584  ORF Transcript_84878/g.169584 Transcript_84878/m.169584 type:complete len:201 (-) Transcript_84878:212-814(-)